MINRILVILCVLAGIAQAQWRSGSSGTFVWSVSGEATASDSLRIIQGSNMTITQSGNTLTIASTGGAAATDYQAWYNESGDSVIIYPGSAIPFILKALTDTLLSIGSGGELQITNDFDIQYLDDTFGAGYFTSPTSAWAMGATGGDYTGGLSGIYFIYQYADTAGDAVNLYRMIIDDDGKVGFGTYTAGQAGRAHFNVLGRASSDTLAIFSNDGGGVVGDSTVMIHASGNIQSGARAGFGVATSGQAARAILNVGRDATLGDTLALFIGDGNRVPGDSTAMIFGNGDMTVGRELKITNTGGLFYIGGNVAIVRTGSVFIFGNGLNFNGVKGQVGLGDYFASSTTGRWQGIANVRAGSVSSDTLLVVRNDWNSTLDSTAMVFADGRIYRRDTKPLPAGAWLATASNGAALSSSNYIVTYAFDQTTAETLTVDFALPPNFGMINNVEIEVISPNTDGDSVGYAVAWLGRAADEAFDVAFSSALSGQIDLGTTANVRKILTISGTFSNLAASDRIIFKLWRDPSVDNNVAADVHFVDMRVNGAGLLH